MDKRNVGVGKPMATGAIFAAPDGTLCPQTAAEKLDDAFKDLGYANEDGVVNSFDESYSETKAWGGEVIDSSLEESKEFWEFTCIETNPHVAREFFGAENVVIPDEDDPDTWDIKSSACEKVAHPWVIDKLISSTRRQRTIIPLGKVIEVGDVEYKDGTPISYKMKIQAFPCPEGYRAIRKIASRAAAAAPEPPGVEPDEIDKGGEPGEVPEV